MEPENVTFMTSCPFIYRLKYMHYSLMGKMRLSFIDSDLLYRLIEVLLKASLTVLNKPESCIYQILIKS